MKRTIETKCYDFWQNSSGGHYVRDSEYGVSEHIIIEAQTAKEANNRLREIGENVSVMFAYCECCGLRWRDAIEEDAKEDEPEAQDGVFIHYYDGTIKGNISKKLKG